MPVEFDTYGKLMKEGRGDRNHFILNYDTLVLFNNGVYDRMPDNPNEYDLDLVKQKLEYYKAERDKYIEYLVSDYKTKIEKGICQWFLDYTIYRYQFLLADEEQRKKLLRPSDRIIIRVQETSGYDISWEMMAATKAVNEIVKETGYNIHVTFNPDSYTGLITVIFY